MLEQQVIAEFAQRLHLETNEKLTELELAGPLAADAAFTEVVVGYLQPTKLDEFVPLIFRFANTQNPVQLADLSANSAFHIRLEQLSEQVWCPGEESRWFYERARGSYDVARARFGSTNSKRREFDLTCPRRQRFGKPDLAKYWMSWWQLPHVVSKGAQKNFAAFMAELREHFGTDWQPDERFYRHTIAVGLIFEAAKSIVRRAQLQSYGANVVTYLVGKLAAEREAERRFTEGVGYRQKPISSYAHLMRAWPGFEARDGIYDHVLRHLPRD